MKKRIDYEDYKERKASAKVRESRKFTEEEMKQFRTIFTMLQKGYEENANTQS